MNAFQISIISSLPGFFSKFTKTAPKWPFETGTLMHCAVKLCPVVSNNSAHRFTADVPMVVPELNAEHINIIPEHIILFTH